MLIFVIAEMMFFAGLVSAFTIVRTTAFSTWPPPGQPRLPVEQTALNTTALLASGVLLFFAGRAFRRGEEVLRLLSASMVLGAAFVFFQGVEWVALVREGLTMTSSTHGSFFYLIIGAHGAHAIAALAGLGYAHAQMLRGRLTREIFSTVQVFWYFVVGVWPLLYWRVYL